MMWLFEPEKKQLMPFYQMIQALLQFAGNMTCKNYNFCKKSVRHILYQKIGLCVLSRMGSMHMYEQCVDVMQRASKERSQRTFEEMPITVWKTRASKRILSTDSKQDGVAFSKILGRLLVVLDLAVMIP